MQVHGNEIRPDPYPVLAIECEPVINNRYTLVRAAAARARQLDRGAVPRLDLPWVKPAQIALAEIAAGALDKNEIDRLLGLDRSVETPTVALDLPESQQFDELQLLDGMTRSLAATPAPRDEELDSATDPMEGD
jgi:DNA-directed RNA polymerase omega subunit